MAGFSYCDPYKQFQQQQQELSGLLEESARVIDKLGMTQCRDTLARLGEKVRSDSFKIQVVGTFKNGKSTFINAFLGENVLPAYALPCTAVINEVKYGKEKRAVLHFRQPLPETLPSAIPQAALEHMKKHNMENVPPMEIPYQSIEEYVVIPMGEDPKQMLLESPYEKVELFWPLMLLEQGVQIIDSPGLNEHATRTKVTTEYLSQADAVLFVLNAQALCSQEEMSFIENNMVSQGFEDTFFVVNRYDCIPQREKPMIQQFARMKLGKLTSFGESGIYFLSGLQALNGKKNRDTALMKASGMPGFEMRLSQYLTRRRGKAKLAHSARELRRVLKEEALLKVIPKQRQLLGSELKDVKQRYLEEKPRLTQLQAQKDQLARLLEKRIEAGTVTVRGTIRENMDQIARLVPEWIEAFTPKEKLGVVPNKDRVAAVIGEYSAHISQQLELHQLAWRKDTLGPALEKLAREVFEGVQADVSQLLSQLESVSHKVSGVAGKESGRGSWQRMLSGAGVEDQALISAGSTDAVARAVSRKSGLDVGAGVLLGTLSLAAPAVLCAAAIGSVLYGWIKGNPGSEKKLKKALTDQICGQIREKTPRIINSTADTVGKYLQELAQTLTANLEGEIRQADLQLSSIVAEMEKGEAYIEQRQEELKECQQKLRRLSAGLDSLIFRLVE